MNKIENKLQDKGIQVSVRKKSEAVVEEKCIYAEWEQSHTVKLIWRLVQK